MQKYSFVRPSIHRYRSPDNRNNTAYMNTRLENMKNNFFDLNLAKKKLFSPKNKVRPTRPVLGNLKLPSKPEKKMSDAEGLLLESPFLKTTIKGPQKIKAKFNISDVEIEKIKNQIWGKMK
mmetsp:Transcript_11053/g.10966  ORF Transcript_11053/g.10966 Transcript_11053/m.10966 type:complete len:121 (+) Transcript_11053:210-572(+)